MLAQLGQTSLKDRRVRELDTNIQNHEGIGGCRMGKRLEHQRKSKMTKFRIYT